MAIRSGKSQLVIGFQIEKQPKFFFLIFRRVTVLLPDKAIHTLWHMEKRYRELKQNLVKMCRATLGYFIEYVVQCSVDVKNCFIFYFQKCVLNLGLIDD